MYSIHYIIKKILFPRSCLGCSAPDSTLCKACLKKLPICMSVRMHSNHREMHVFPYTHKKIAKIIWELKYKNNTELRSILFSLIGPVIENYVGTWVGGSNNSIYIISVPKAKNDTLKKRDFDHGNLLVRALVPYLTNNSMVVLEGYLVKKDIGRQAAQKNRTERIKNMNGAIMPTEKLVNFKPTRDPLIIIDDVTTTGATREEMIRALKQYFTGEILFIALAH